MTTDHVTWYAKSFPGAPLACIECIWRYLKIRQTMGYAESVILQGDAVFAVAMRFGIRKVDHLEEKIRKIGLPTKGDRITGEELTEVLEGRPYRRIKEDEGFLRNKEIGKKAASVCIANLRNGRSSVGDKMPDEITSAKFACQTGLTKSQVYHLARVIPPVIRGRKGGNRHQWLFPKGEVVRLLQKAFRGDPQVTPAIRNAILAHFGITE